MKARTAMLAAMMALALCSFGRTATTTQPPLLSTGEGPHFFVDYANFRGLDQKTYVEFYLQVPYDELQFIKTRNHFRAEYVLQLRLLDANDKELERETIHDVVDVATFEETISPSKARVCLFGFTIDATLHRVKAELRDLETRYSTRIEQDFTPKNFGNNDLLISDIQFSQKITPAAEGEAYVKNQRYIEPNPLKIFARELSEHLFVYFEIYNLAVPQPDGQQTYTVSYLFLDRDGNTIAELKRDRGKASTSAAHSLRFRVSQFEAGEYSLVIRIQDNDTLQTSEVANGFTILQQPVSLSQNILN
ncbi:MAG: hypothetical protein ACE5IY_04915 [bacterium]